MRKIPIVAIRGSVVFPFSDTLLSFGRNKSVNAVNASFTGDRMVAVFAQKDGKKEDPGKEDLYSIGTLVSVAQMMSTDNEVHALVRGRQRVKLLGIESSDPFLLGTIEEIPQIKEESPEISALANRLSDLFKKAINLGKSAEIITVMRLVSEVVDSAELTDQIASVLDAKFHEKQQVLEELNLLKRMSMTQDLLAREVNVLEIEKSITK